RHRLADLHEQSEPRGDIERGVTAIFVDRPAFDMLHDEERAAVRRGPAVDQPRDERVLETGEDLTLVAEAAEHFVGVHTAAHDFDRDEFPVLIVIALGEIYRSHAARARFPNESGPTKATPARRQPARAP